MSERLNDGYQTTLSFAADPTVLFEEKSVTPPSLDGGGEIDITVMSNTDWRTKAAKSLILLGSAKMTVAYDPACYTEIIALVNDNNLITLTFPDGDTLSFWGWLDSFAPGELTEGEQATAEIEIIPSLLDDALVETAPVHT